MRTEDLKTEYWHLPWIGEITDTLLEAKQTTLDKHSIDCDTFVLRRGYDIFDINISKYKITSYKSGKTYNCSSGSSFNNLLKKVL